MRLQPAETLGRNAPLELGHAAEPGQVEIRGDVGQRIQNEIALHYPGMRQAQVRLGSLLAPESEQVEINDTRSPALMLRRAPELALQRAQRLKQGVRVKLRQRAEHRIDEVRLRDRSEGARAIQR